MRRPLIAANWKMNFTQADVVSFFETLNAKVNDYLLVDVAIFPPSTLLDAAREAAVDRIIIGAQNCYYEKSGAYTGEISVEMIKDQEAGMVILGHSERRTIFNETNELINKKLIAACKGGLTPILCIGENLEQRESGQTNDVLKTQIIECLKSIQEKDMKHIIIAYEPIWAISGGDANKKAATPEDAESAHKFLRELLSSLYTRELADEIKILYGGSMKPENVDSLIILGNVDGGLVGGASLDPLKFLKLIASANHHYSQS